MTFSNRKVSYFLSKIEFDLFLLNTNNLDLFSIFIVTEIRTDFPKLSVLISFQRFIKTIANLFLF